MTPHRHEPRAFTMRSLLAVFSLACLLPYAQPAPINNFQDPYITHSVMGTDKFYTPREHLGFSLQISPYYTHTAAAGKPAGGKTSAGNVHGQWDMAGMLYNPPGALTPSMQAARQVIADLVRLGLVEASVYSGATAESYLDEAKHSPTYFPQNALLLKDVQLKMEKKGIRGQLSFDFAFGLGITIKGGVADMKNTLKAFVPQDQVAIDAGLMPTSSTEGPAQSPNPGPAHAKRLYAALLSPNAIRLFGGDSGLDFESFAKTDLEDAHADVHWSVPITITEKGQHAFTMVPYLSVGAWLPLAQERNPNKVFALTAGNNGFTGFTADAALSLDFPGMMQLSVGGGATMFMRRDLPNVRVPTSVYQTGFYPWKTSISNRPGPLWYFNVSMKAENFFSKKDIPNFSCYIDYVYVEHLKDSVKLKEKSAGFQARPDVMEAQSVWKSQHLCAGLTLGLSSHVFLGVAAQSTISSSRTYRPTTLLTSLLILF